MRKLIDYNPNDIDFIIKQCALLQQNMENAMLGRMNKQLQIAENYKPLIDTIKDLKPLI